jgi:hypothetical protein
MITPRFPTEYCNAAATALLVWPETLFAGQLARTVAAPKVPDKAKKVAPYATSGVLLVMKTMYPMMDKLAPKMMNAALRLVLSAYMARTMVKRNAAK